MTHLLFQIYLSTICFTYSLYFITTDAFLQTSKAQCYCMSVHTDSAPCDSHLFSDSLNPTHLSKSSSNISSNFQASIATSNRICHYFLGIHKACCTSPYFVSTCVSIFDFIYSRTSLFAHVSLHPVTLFSESWTVVCYSFSSSWILEQCLRFNLFLMNAACMHK